MDAARHWAEWTPPAAPGARDASLAAFGLVLDGADDAASADDGEFAVWPENQTAVRLFLDCATQWRISGGMGAAVWLGFDYAGVRAMLEVREVKHRKAVFEDLMVMEGAALAALAGISRRAAARPAAH